MTELRFRILGGRAYLYEVGYDRAGADLRLSFGEGVEGTLRLGRRILPLSGGAAVFPRASLPEGECEALLFLPGRTVPCTPIRAGRDGIAVSPDALAAGCAVVALDTRLRAAEEKIAALAERVGEATIL
ncbi:MAG TPA: hypothetical protein DDY70_00740 [Clostridiales bacterium]|nr:hypothetical protein [Clostridiales bacterium]